MSYADRTSHVDAQEDGLAAYVNAMCDGWTAIRFKRDLLGLTKDHQTALRWFPDVVAWHESGSITLLDPKRSISGDGRTINIEDAAVAGLWAFRKATEVHRIGASDDTVNNLVQRAIGYGERVHNALPAKVSAGFVIPSGVVAIANIIDALASGRGDRVAKASDVVHVTDIGSGTPFHGYWIDALVQRCHIVTVDEWMSSAI